MKTTDDTSGAAHVLFTADFSGGTITDGWWGYYLKRGSDGLWHIIDARVA